MKLKLIETDLPKFLYHRRSRQGFTLWKGQSPLIPTNHFQLCILYVGGERSWQRETSVGLLIKSGRWVVVQLLSHVLLLATPWTAACQASLSFTISRSLLKLMSIESVMLSNHLILCLPLPSIFPSIRVFSSHQVDKVLELQLQLQSFQWIFRRGSATKNQRVGH